MSSREMNRWFRTSDFFVFHRDGNDAVDLELNRVIDAELTGLPAPRQSTSLSADARGRLEPLRQTITTAFTLARQADHERREQNDHDRQQIWEQLMTTAQFPQTVAQPSGYAAAQAAFPTEKNPHVRKADRYFGRSYVLNAVLAACLVFALATGAWVTGQRFSGGNGGEDPVQFGMTGQVEGTPGATPDLSSIAPIEWPTADDCTVTPLTVDEVIAILRNPVGYFIAVQAPSTPTAVEAEATNKANLDAALRGEAGVVTPEIMERVVAVQREWVACTMKGSYFQVWALEYPVLVAEQVEDVLPLFTSEEEARALLTQLEEEGSVDGFLPQLSYGRDRWISLIDPDPANSWYSASADGSWAMVWASQINYDEGGFAVNRSLYGSDATQNGSYAEWRFTSLNDEGPWMIEQVGGDRG